MKTSYTRQELYELVWSEPMSTLAPRYGISDVAVAKTCRKTDIPLPPRGYWARVAAGQKITRPVLPERRLGMSETVEIGGGGYYYSAPEDLIEREIPPPPEFAETTEELIERVKGLVGKVTIPKLTSKTHRLVARLLENDEFRRKKQAEASYPMSWDNPLFDSPFDRRRLRLVNAIFVAAEKAGFKPSMRGNDPSEFGVRIGDQHVAFTLDRPGMSRSGYRSDSELSLPASEKLKMQIGIHRQVEGIRTGWEDGEDGTVEDHAESMVVNLIAAGELQYR